MTEKNTDMIEFDLDELLPALAENIKEDIKTPEDLISIDGFVRREI